MVVGLKIAHNDLIGATRLSRSMYIFSLYHLITNKVTRSSRAQTHIYNFAAFNYLKARKGIITVIGLKGPGFLQLFLPPGGCIGCLCLCRCSSPANNKGGIRKIKSKSQRPGIPGMAKKSLKCFTIYTGCFQTEASLHPCQSCCCGAL